MSEASVVRSPRIAPALLDGVPRRTTRVEAVDEVLREHDIGVIAAGTRSQPLLEQVRVPVRVAPRRGQMMVFDRGDLPHVVRTTKRQLALLRADGRVAVGVTWEDVGFDTATDDAVLDELEAWAREQVPGLGVRETAWTGRRPWSVREGPTIGWASDRVIVGVGHHRDGLVLAPATGELIRDLVLERAPSVDPASFAVPTR
jgi:glycine oxidase